MPGYKKRLIKEFSHFGDNVDFQDLELEDNGDFIMPSRIYINTEYEILNQLRNYVHDKMDLNNGFNARLEIISLDGLGNTDLDNERFRYSIEVTLDKNLSIRERVESNESYLMRLPKVVKNFRLQKPRKKK